MGWEAVARGPVQPLQGCALPALGSTRGMGLSPRSERGQDRALQDGTECATDQKSYQSPLRETTTGHRTSVADNSLDF
jgi:hypothetical protein